MWSAGGGVVGKYSAYIVGTMLIVMNVSFHCTAKATINAVTNVDSPWTVRVNFSDMPLLTLFPLVVTWLVIEPASESK